MKRTRTKRQKEIKKAPTQKDETEDSYSSNPGISCRLNRNGRLWHTKSFSARRVAATKKWLRGQR